MKKTKTESDPDEWLPLTGQNCSGLTLMLSSYKSQMPAIHELVIQQAIQTSVWVLDMGNCFDPLSLIRPMRRQTIQIHAVLDHIHVARAFTCFQVISLLRQTQHPSGQVFILDALTTFSDEVIPRRIRTGLLGQLLAHIDRLKWTAPVLLTTGSPRHLEVMPEELLNRLKKQASRVIAAHTTINTPPARLF